jgi:hypothetical protein
LTTPGDASLLFGDEDHLVTQRGAPGPCPSPHDRRRRVAPGGLVLAAPRLVAHPDRLEDRLLLHFATGVQPIKNGAWPELTHRFTARVQGQPRLENLGPAQAIVFNGFTDWLLAAPDRATAEPGLPKRELSLTAWVVVNEPCHHHPCFSSDEDDYGDQSTEGVRHIVSGGGGGGLEQAAPQRAWFTVHIRRGHHYCFAAVHDRTIQFKAYDLEGRLFDTFELTKPQAGAAGFHSSV